MDRAPVPKFNLVAKLLVPCLRTNAICNAVDGLETRAGLRVNNGAGWMQEAEHRGGTQRGTQRAKLWCCAGRVRGEGWGPARLTIFLGAYRVGRACRREGLLRLHDCISTVG